MNTASGRQRLRKNTFASVAAKNVVLLLMSSRPPKHRGGRNNICISSGRKGRYLTPSEAEKIEGCIRTSKTPKKHPLWETKPTYSTLEQRRTDIAWRKSWEMIVNEEQERHGIADRVDCRSHAARGLTENSQPYTKDTTQENWNPWELFLTAAN